MGDWEPITSATLETSEIVPFHFGVGAKVT